ncbi:MAG: transketolase C-terminal domain-containing protein [Actinomycetota bacterium]|nr:transketolase C-terminal domain-containing protein [Actinomycetota bacterium]
MRFGAAIDDALGQAMAQDPRIVVFGEDVPLLRRELLVRFGRQRVLGTPISESAFLGAGVGAAMAGLRPVVELYMVDFLGVCMDALLNHAAKVETFSGGTWKVPLVVRAPCGGGYGDGGQHEQSLWGWLAHIPGLTVVVPSTPADAGALMLAALEHEGPVVFLEHKLLSESCLEFLGSGGRKNVTFDVPADGTRGPVPDSWQAAPIGKAVLRREGNDVTIVSVGVSVHRALEAADMLASEGVSAAVVDLRTVSPLDTEMVCAQVERTGRLLVVDEDYEGFGLSGELAAVVAENGLRASFARVCTRETIPYARDAEDRTLPNVNRIRDAVLQLMS